MTTKKHFDINAALWRFRQFTVQIEKKEAERKHLEHHLRECNADINRYQDQREAAEQEIIEAFRSKQ